MTYESNYPGPDAPRERVEQHDQLVRASDPERKTTDGRNVPVEERIRERVEAEDGSIREELGSGRLKFETRTLWGYVSLDSQGRGDTIEVYRRTGDGDGFLIYEEASELALIVPELLGYEWRDGGDGASCDRHASLTAGERNPGLSDTRGF